MARVAALQQAKEDAEAAARSALTAASATGAETRANANDDSTAAAPETASTDAIMRDLEAAKTSAEVAAAAHAIAAREASVKKSFLFSLLY